MSATAPAPHAGTGSFDISGTAPIPLTRLVGVELRKLVDTRSGRWLLIIMVSLILLGSVIYAWATRDGSVDFFGFTAVAGNITGILLPVLAIMSVTTEWSQRTNMATFTLEPRRVRVVAAKLVATVIAAVVSVAVAVAIGALGAALAAGFGAQVDWDPNVEGILGFTLLQVISLLVGFALATLLLNTPAAIVTFFAYYTIIPGLLLLAGAYFSWFEDIRPWIDFVSASGRLATGFDGVEWGQLATSGLLWFVLPLVLGVARMLRAEIK
ncbi:ABC-2 type transport system permease protein [Nocardioides zeae]|uniref:ABC-2 type transport system permease protein n=2 Tax=Nocardioides zeae TaxID=1457234 RepID=A0AAJ1TVR0_9ACTN|nr:ABC transporter permease [Nocardioides zeae]MDQ1102950.1 ABC-2 type transport system permease protein [Nocardioides zeae]MDR6173316.1 ABC-2 type transport system permease protein [Nocardioides zeae]MDR6211956.1 ABC-2 type transport system permease protein [Nocardioides zeae]